jgi:hypothetical protein
MGVSAGIRASARELLDPGDRIRYLFPAELLLSTRPYVYIMISDQAVTVLATGVRKRAPLSVRAKYSRDVRVGPPELTTPPSFVVAGIWYQIEDEYVAVVNAANAELDGSDGLPPDPLAEM